MEADARYTWVGAAVLALVAALVGAIVWLKNVGAQADFARYAVYFEQQPLDGLQIGAEVALRGIRVGRVEDYALADDKVNRVRVELRLDRRTPVYTETTAVVMRNFVTGIASITLINADPPGAPLTEPADGDTLPVIREGRSDIAEIAGRVSRIGEVASVTLASLNELLSAGNRAEVLQTVRSLRRLAGGLEARLETVDATLLRVGRAAADVGAAAGSLGRSGERLAAVGERAGTRLDATFAEADRALAEARTALDRLAAAADAMQRQTAATAGRLEDTAAHVDDQVGAAVTELRVSVDAAARVLERLRDPRAALLGPGPTQLGPGERLP